MSVYVLDLRVSKFSKWGLNLSDKQVAGPVANVCCVCLWSSDWGCYGER